jgi:hypothetical protein
MLEQVDCDDLEEGQQYYVVHRRGAFVEGDLIYVGHCFKYPNGIQTFQLNEHLYHFYRYVSKYQYYMALKEKYNQTCLTIILKRLVNENFEW